jgi:hypothetical protein
MYVPASASLCGKKIYQDKKTAQSVRNFLRENGRLSKKVKDLRIYFCEPCRGWHLTKSL